MRLTRTHCIFVIAAWVMILLYVAVGQAATLPQPLLDVQANICRVRTGDGSGGSGVYLASTLVLSADHVTDGSPKGTVRFFDGGTYPYVVDGRSRKRDGSCLIISRPSELNIQAIRLATRDPVEGDVVWKAGFGKGIGKLYWDRCRVMGLRSDDGRMILDKRSIGGDSGGPCFFPDGTFIGCLQSTWRATTSAPNGLTYANTTSQTATLLGPYVVDLLNVEAELVAWCPDCQVQARPRILKRLTPNIQGLVPKQSQPKQDGRAEGTIPAELFPSPDTGLVSAQFAAMQDQASAALDQADTATQAALAQADESAAELTAMIEQSRVDKQDREHAARMAELDAKSDPREEAAPSQTSASEMAREFFPWIVIVIAGLVGFAMYVLKDRKKDGNTSVADLTEGAAVGMQTAAAAEKFIEVIMARLQPPSPSPLPTPQPLPIGVVAPTTTERIHAIVASQAGVDLAAKQKTEEAVTARAQNQLEATRIVEDRTTKLEQATAAVDTLAVRSAEVTRNRR